MMKHSDNAQQVQKHKTKHGRGHEQRKQSNTGLVHNSGVIGFFAYTKILGCKG